MAATGKKGRPPKGKTIRTLDGTIEVRGKVPNGSGSLYPTADGRWRGAFVDDAGKRHYLSGRTREIVEARVEAARLKVATPERAPSSDTVTVGDAARRWLDQKKLRPSSLAEYAKDVERIASSSIGPLPIAELGYPDLERWWNGLFVDGNTRTGRGLKAETAAGIRQVLAQVLTQAMRDGVAARGENMARWLEAPRAPEDAPDESRRIFTIEESHAVIRSAEKLRNGLAVPLLIVNAMRASEVLGLAWGDIGDGTFRVERGSIYVSGEGVRFGPPKTAGALGRHFQGPAVGRYLALRRERWQAEHDHAESHGAWISHAYKGAAIDPIFVGPDGRMVTRQALTQLMGAACRAAGVDPTGAASHTGRRTHYSRMLEAGELEADVMDNVGHARRGIVGTYDQRGEGRRTKAYANRAARLLDPFAS
jgi:integrase